MADEQLSENTKAIVERLKREGLLTRNEGVNSIKSLGVKFDKFSGVLQSINTNVIAQNTMLSKQLDLAYDAAVASRDAEQFKEIEGKNSASTASTSSGGDDGEDEKKKFINKMGDSIASAFSLKNLAMGLAGGFAGYNILKGFVDEKTNGGFSAFESNIGNIVSDLGKVDFSTLAPTMATLTETIGTLKTTIDDLAKTISDITNFGWGDIFGALITSLGMLQAYNLTMGVINKAMARKAGGVGGKGGRSRLLRMMLGGGLGAGAIAASGAFTPDEVEAEKKAQAQAKADEAEARRRAASRSNPANYNYPKPDAKPVNTAPERTPVKEILPDAEGNVRSRGGASFAADSPQGRMIMTGGGTRELTATQRAALNGQLDVKPPAPKPRQTAPGRTAMGTSGINAPNSVDSGGRIGKEILAQNKDRISKSIASKVGRVFIKAIPGLGLLAGAGFALWSLARGDFTTAALEAASIPAPSVAGVPMDVGAVATAVFFEIVGTTYIQTNADHREIMVGIGEEVARQFEEWKAKREAEGKSFVERTNQMAADERTIAGGARAFSDSGIAPDFTESMGTDPYTGESSGSLSTSPNFRGGYFTDKYGKLMFQTREGKIMRADRPNLNDLSGADGGGTTIINNTPVVAPQTITTSSAGSTVNVTQASFMGGGGMMMDSPYNLSNAIS